MCWHVWFSNAPGKRYEFEIVRCNPHHKPYSIVGEIWCKRYWREDTRDHVKQWQNLKAHMFHWGFGGSPNEIGKNFHLGQLAACMANPRIGEGHPSNNYNPGWQFGIEVYKERVICSARVERVIQQKRPSATDKDYVWDLVKGKTRLPEPQLPVTQERVSWNPETRGNLGFACSPDFFLPDPDYRFLEEKHKKVDLKAHGLTHGQLTCSPEESDSENEVFLSEQTEEESYDEEDEKIQLSNLKEMWDKLKSTEGIIPIPVSYTEWRDNNPDLEGQDILYCSKKWREMLSTIYQQMYERQREEWIEETCCRLRELGDESN